MPGQLLQRLPTIEPALICFFQQYRLANMSKILVIITIMITTSNFERLSLKKLWVVKYYA